jgi:ABC-type transporter Mla MlaB component
VTTAQLAATGDGFALSGSLVTETVPAVYADGLRQLSAGRVRRIDLTDVLNIDSAGVAVLLAWLSAVPAGVALPTIHGLPPSGRALARVGGVLGLLEPTDT